MTWFCVQCFAFFRRVELKPACILLLVVMVTFFICPDLFTFAEPALSLSSLSQRFVTANACEWTTLCAFKLLSFKKFLGTLEGQQAYSRWKDYFDHFSVVQVIIVRVFSFSFFSFNCIVLLSFCTQIFLSLAVTEVAENDNCRQWLQNNRLFACKQLLELDLTEASKTNPYVQFSVFSSDSVCWV